MTWACRSRRDLTGEARGEGMPARGTRWGWGECPVGTGAPLSASLTHTEPPRSPLSQVSLFGPPVCELGSLTTVSLYTCGLGPWLGSDHSHTSRAPHGCCPQVFPAPSHSPAHPIQLDSGSSSSGVLTAPCLWN